MTTFDGDNLRVILAAPTAGVLDVNVQADLYSAWKIWMLTDSNRKYPALFRTVGGDPLTPGVDAGAYFFMRNDLGWRIISSDADQTVNYNGNLVGEDSSVSLIVPTPGRSVLHLGLQPVTQRVDEILQQAQDAAYNGVVAYRDGSGNTGTAFPIGTQSRPVDSVSDFFSIANNLGVQKGEVTGPMVLDRNAEGWGFDGGSAVDNDQLTLGGFSFDRTRFRGLTLTGVVSGIIEAIECKILVVLGLHGFFRRCGLEGALSIASSSSSTFDSCFSRMGGLSTPSISIGANAVVGLRNWSGGLELRDMSSGSVVTIDCDPGVITIDSSCTGGTLVLNGFGSLTDNSGAVTVIKDGFMDTVDINTLIQVSAGNADVSGDDLLVTIRNPDLTVLRTLSVSADGRTRRIV